jgi:alpha-glucosidase
MAIDVPGRVHTWNTQNDRETAPDRVGDLASNLAAVRRRYELVPYVYSLAHRAYADGDPVFPPLVWAFPEDAEARTLGGEKLIGDQLLAGLVAKDGARTIDVYLPAGASWVDYDTGRRLEGGQWLRGLPLRDASGVLRLPLFARAGAIIPVAFVDDQTWNTLGKRGDGVRHDELRARVFAGGGDTSFTLVEDDGETIAYKRGELRRTEVRQRTGPHAIAISIAAASGAYAGAPARRAAVIDVALPQGARPSRVTGDGTTLPAAGCDSGAPSWCEPRPGWLQIKLGDADVTHARSIELEWR